MSYEPVYQHGNADYRSWMQVPSGLVIVEGADSIPLEDRKYASFVYQVNPSPVTINGAVYVSLSSTDALMTQNNNLTTDGNTSLSSINNQMVTVNSALNSSNVSLSSIDNGINTLYSSLSDVKTLVAQSNTLLLSSNTTLSSIQSQVNNLNEYQRPKSEYVIDVSQLSGVIYVCKADPGTALSSALWQIKKVTTTGTSGIFTRTQWADGNVNYDNVAEDAQTLTYL